MSRRLRCETTGKWYRLERDIIHGQEVMKKVFEPEREEPKIQWLDNLETMMEELGLEDAHGFHEEDGDEEFI